MIAATIRWARAHPREARAESLRLAVFVLALTALALAGGFGAAEWLTQGGPL